MAATQITDALRDFKIQLSTTLATMLFTVASIAVAALEIVHDPNKTLLDEFLAILAVFSIFSASILLDAALDLQNISSKERWKFLGRGYLLFCLMITLLTFAIPILYDVNRYASTNPDYGWWHTYWIFFAVSGILVGWKMMTEYESFGNTVLVALMFVVFILDGLALFVCNPAIGWFRALPCLC
jgi:hypothetical protein